MTGVRVGQGGHPGRPQEFRLQFFGVGPSRRPIIVSEIGIRAVNAEAAIRESTVAIWPPNAIGLRILNPEGHKVFEKLKPDRR
jgi:hypothetical protein